MRSQPKQDDKPIKRRPPARTPDAEETQMVSMAYDLAKKQLADGTASSQVITHFLKLGSSRERLEKEMLVEQKALLNAKTESIQSSKRIEELYKEALNAMQSYSGRKVEERDDDD